jgi:type III restriction enzyme
MKINFDPNQAFQNEAVASVTELFDGQPHSSEFFETDSGPLAGTYFSDIVFRNNLIISNEKIYQNLQGIQKKNNIEDLSEDLSFTSEEGIHYPNFSVEMETGTGKTYVYLKTIFELHKNYGFSKFVIVVPSVAIREGVMANIRLTREHFSEFYNSKPDAWTYDRKNVHRLKHFATSNNLQILILNLDSFNKKDNNVIHRSGDNLIGGKTPIQFIQQTNPIVIMDEPQNMESEKSVSAINSLHPMCTLRYSATHKFSYSLLYRLTPVDAYDLKLVKRIEVDSVLANQDLNKPFIELISVKTSKSGPTARVKIDVLKKSSSSRTIKQIKSRGDSLFSASGGLNQYDGFVVEDIDASMGFVEFSNGITIFLGDPPLGVNNDKIMQTQIEETIREHLEKELLINRRFEDGKRMKVISLIFIDRVDNYYSEDGKIRKWFEEMYDNISSKPKYSSLDLPNFSDVHSGYFAKSKDGKAKDSNGNTKADNAAYELIMRDKERLLSLREPIRFIFSHSALREGWDNPNVFQICTLNETKSEIKKRQEIGRGLRLPVDETGNRCKDDSVNKLTIIANQSYEEFAKALQTEIENDCGVSFGSRIQNKRNRRRVNLKKAWNLDANFKSLWEKIQKKTRYVVNFNTEEFIQKSIVEISSMEEIPVPKIAVIKVGIQMGEHGVSTSDASRFQSKDSNEEILSIPNPVTRLSNNLGLTRATISNILMNTNRLEEIRVNPEGFLKQIETILSNILEDMIVDGIQYSLVDELYEMRLFESSEMDAYITNLYEVENADKSITDLIPFDSDIEKRFAEGLDARDDVKMFIKLPRWFKVRTPMGKYNPDWAIVFEEENKLFMIAETKGTLDLEQLRKIEYKKLICGKRHFEVIEGVKFKLVSEVSDLP